MIRTGNVANECWQRRSLWTVVSVHTGLLAYLGWYYFPTQDEVAHLPAGLIVWKFGDCSVYRVNPPMVRTVAALPVLLMEHREDWSEYRPKSDLRLEWVISRHFLKANGTDSFRLFTAARWACIPFSVIGLLVVYAWGCELSSPRVGLTAACLWCISPNLLGHGALITPDVAMTSFGLLAAWRLSKWLSHSTAKNAVLAGLALGSALLTKTSWILLLGIWPGLVLLDWQVRRPQPLGPRIAQLGLMLFLALNVLNLGYLFDGTFTPLGDYGFYSRSLAEELRTPGEQLPANRFADSWLGRIPVPLPADYVTGIDLQKLDFEHGKWSYLMGEVRHEDGWWYYYIVGLFLKVPLGVWGLFLVGLTQLIRHRQARCAGWQLLPLIVPALILFVLASLQTGMQRHVRYVFPMLPVLYLVGANAADRFPRTSGLLVLLTALSSLAVYPHSLSYFNESIGGPAYGHRYLIDSNLDWGQEMHLVRKWIEEHPSARPIYVAWIGDVALQDVGIDALPIPADPQQPGWYVISRHKRLEPNSRVASFHQRPPVDTIGYTFDVYYIPDSSPRPAFRSAAPQ